MALARAAKGKPWPIGPKVLGGDGAEMLLSTPPEKTDPFRTNQMRLGWTKVDLGSPLGHLVKWVPDKEPAFKEVIRPLDPCSCLGSLTLLSL